MRRWSTSLITGAVWLAWSSQAAWAQEASLEVAGGREASFFQTLIPHLPYLWIALYTCAALFVICLIWEVSVAIQLKANGGVLPEPPEPAVESAPAASSLPSYVPPVLDEEEEPFKALLNKARESDERRQKEKAKEKAAPAPTPAPTAPEPSGPVPYRNIDPVRTGDVVTRRDPNKAASPTSPSAPAPGFGSKTMGFGATTSGFATKPANAPIGFGGAAAPAPNPFAPPKAPTSPAAPSVAPGGGIALPKSGGGFAPPKSSSATTLPLGSTTSGFAPAPKQAAGGFAPPKAPGGGFTPPKASGFAPPKAPGAAFGSGTAVGFTPPKAPSGGFAPPKAPGFAPPKGGGAAFLPPGRANTPPRPGAVNPQRVGPAATFPAAPGRNSEDSWKALVQGIEQREGLALDIKRGGSVSSAGRE